MTSRPPVRSVLLLPRLGQRRLVPPWKASNEFRARDILRDSSFVLRMRETFSKRNKIGEKQRESLPIVVNRTEKESLHVLLETFCSKYSMKIWILRLYQAGFLPSSFDDRFSWRLPGCGSSASVIEESEGEDREGCEAIKLKYMFRGTWEVPLNRKRDGNRAAGDAIAPTQPERADSGWHVGRSIGWFVSTFRD